MECTYMTGNGRLSVKFDATSEKEVFRQIAKIQEVFEEPSCGQCGATNLILRVRNVTSGKKTFEYFESVCQECGCRLAYGQSQDTLSLFPKRKVGEKGKEVWDNKYRGWGKWTPEEE